MNMNQKTKQCHRSSENTKPNKSMLHGQPLTDIDASKLKKARK